LSAELAGEADSLPWRGSSRNAPTHLASAKPSDQALSLCDEEDVITYLRMLDADWRKVSRIVLYIDAEREPDRARYAYGTHLALANWMSWFGYKHLLRRNWGTKSRPDTGRACVNDC
jgi:hypothetical protein